MRNPYDFELHPLLRRHYLGIVFSAWLALLASQGRAGDFRILRHFPNPSNPTGTLLVSDDVIYGVTERGGSANAGTVYGLNTDGQDFRVLHEFAGSDGKEPRAGLVRADDTLYGTTLGGGSYLAGTLFKVRIDGSGFQVLKHFNPLIGEGQQPTGSEPMVLSGTTLYGTTGYSGSSNGVAYGWGTVFRLETDGSGFQVLKNLPSGVESCPWSGLVLGEGALFGTTSGFAGDNVGTVFRLNTDGTGYRTLWQFTRGADAAFPLSGVVRGGTRLYGTTYYGPRDQHYNSGTVFGINTDGTEFTTLHVFDSSGSWPREGLLLANGVIYGPTMWGPGGLSYGTVYALTTNGTTFLQLKRFSGTNGFCPSGLALWRERLYGACSGGGANGGGVVYSLALPTPVIIRDPHSQTAEAGTDAGFTFMAEGHAPLTYELLFYETNLLFSSTNRSLILPQVQPAQSGSYSIRVSNPFGSVTSAAADLSVIAPVPRSLVPGLVLHAPAGTQVNLEIALDLLPVPVWTPLQAITITNTGQWYFDLAATLDVPRFYRAQTDTALGSNLSLSLELVPAITLTGNPGDRLRLDYINKFGPVDDWRTLQTVTLGNSTQLFFDTTAPGKPPRLYRVLPAL